MPGSSKVNGTWRTVTGLSIKVGGTWRTATSGFVKVGGQWKQWFASKIQDAFNRASTVSGLGTSDSGQVWNALRGSWRISGSNTALSDDAASTYPIASINFGNADVKSQVDTSGGVGVAFWVSDAGSWWASYPRYTSSTQTFCDQSQVTNTSNPPAGNCCSGVTSSVTTVCDQSQVTNTSNPPSGSCCSGVTSSQTCNQSQVTNQNNPPAGNCCSGVTTSGGGTACTGGYVESFSSNPGGCCSGISSAVGTYCDQGQTNCGTDSSCSGRGCCSGVFATGGGTSTVCDQNPRNCGTDSTCAGSPACCSGISSSGGGTTTVCDRSPVTNQNNPPAGNCCTTPTTNPGSARSYSNAAASYQKSYTERINGFDCCASQPGPCTNTYTACYYCNPGQELSSYSCYNPATPTTYTCYTDTSTTTSPTTYSCYTGTRTVTNPTTYGCYTTTRNRTYYYCYTQQVNQPTNYSCFTAYTTNYSCFTSTRNVTNYSCFTSTRSVTTYTTALVLASSVSNVVSEAASTTISSNTTGFTSVGSVYVTTVGNVITARAYAGTGVTGTLLGTINNTPTSPTTGTSVGIIKAPSSGSQGSTADNFLTTI